jgi:excisionase family DNA binding protein
MTEPYGHAGATPDFDASMGLLLTEEVAAAYSVDKLTVWRWARNGQIPAMRTPGGDWRFSKAWLFETLGVDDGKSAQA